MFEIRIETDGVAFRDPCEESKYDEGAKALEIARILKSLADDLEYRYIPSLSNALFDFNGNKVGEWKMD